MATKKQTPKKTPTKVKDKVYYSRKFLNKDKGMAAIETTFEFGPSWLYQGGWDAHVVISDCYKASTLDFSCYSVKDIDKALAKVSLILTEFEKLGNLMLENREAAIEAIKKADQARKERKKDNKVSSILDKLNDD
jgi:hypothetical protein